jgi:fluoroquinolone resistance protein
MTTTPVDRPPAELLAFGETELVGVRFVGGAYGGADLIELRTRGVVFEECDFSHARLSSSAHIGSAFLRCTFRNAVLRDAVFDGCKLTGSDLFGAVLRPIRVVGGDWSYVTVRGSDLSGLDLSGVKLAEVDLSESMLHRAVLRDCDLRHARVHHTDFGDADLRGADLEGVDLLGAFWRGAHVDLAQSGLFVIALGLVVD